MKDYSPIYQRLFFFTFWVGATFGFISDEVITPLASYRSLVFLGLDAIMVLLACCTVRKISHIAALAVLLAVSWASTCYSNEMSLTFWANGLRDFLGVMVAYPVICYFMGDNERRKRFEAELDRALLMFLLLQAFCVTYQFIRYGAGDHCGGSFGNWYSGIVSMCIFIASFILVHKSLDNEHIFASLIHNKLPIILLFPTFLNETKISFVLIVLYFVLLMPLDRRYLTRAMWMLPAALGLIWIAGTMYSMGVKEDDDIFDNEYVMEYLTIDDIENAEGGALWDMEQGNAADVPRLTKIMYLPILHEQEPGHEMLGWGIGQFKGGQGMEVSDFAYRYDWLLCGSIPYIFHVHIQLGMLGIVLMALWIVLMVLLKPSWSTGRDYNAQLLFVLIILIIMLYNDSLRDLWMCSFLAFLLAGSWKTAEEDDNDSEDTNQEYEPAIDANIDNAQA